ncbi:MAG TPA: DUF4421 family protein [Bacteroidales bacterium]|nr:DUF4421 family protein [Bacteroidales bacterium]
MNKRIDKLKNTGSRYTKLTACLIILFFSTQYVFADGVKNFLSPHPFGDSYVKDIDSKIGLSADYNINFTNFALLGNDKTRHFSYYPNLRGIITLGARYKFFRISYSFNFKNSTDYNEYYGTTDYFNFQFGIKTRAVWLQFYYSKYHGFYYTEEDIWFPKFTLDSIYPQNNDLSSFELGLKSNIIFDTDFSMEAAFDYTEIQTKSAGSFYVLVNPEISNIKSENKAIIPEEYQEHYSGLKDFNKAFFVSFATGLGYGYSLILGPVNFSNTVFAGPNLQIYSHNGLRVKLPYDLAFKSSLSLNLENFYTGAMVSLDINNHYFDKDIIRKKILVFTYRMGIRL